MNQRAGTLALVGAGVVGGYLLATLELPTGAVAHAAGSELAEPGFAAPIIVAQDQDAVAPKARQRGPTRGDLGYLPGRVTTRQAAGRLAEIGFSGAFVYTRPSAWGL